MNSRPSKMINKDKTIAKAFSKYHEIYPIVGKKTLTDCFFSLRGEILFQFRGKDKKVHVMKAVEEKRTEPIICMQWDFFGKMHTALTRPILIRSLFIKPKKAVHQS